jgi:hypothetical protein
MNTHSTIAVRALLVAVVASLLCALSGCASAIPKGQTRFVAVDKFEEIRDCQQVKIGDQDWQCGYSKGTSAVSCAREPTNEPIPYGTRFYGLVVSTRDIPPREKVKEVITKDGQVIAVRSKMLEGADVFYSNYADDNPYCLVDGSIVTDTGAMSYAFELRPEGPLPAGIYHFELISIANQEVLSAGDFTIAAP